MRKIVFAIIVLLFCARSTPGAPRPEMVLQIGHNDEVDALAFTSDNRWLASGGRAQIKIWDAQSGELFRTIVPGDDARKLVWSPNDEILASGGYHSVTLWKRDGTLLRSLPPTRWHAKTRLGWRDIPNRVEGLAWSSDGSTLAVTGNGVELWNVASGQMIKRIEEGDNNYTDDVAFSPDGALLGVELGNVVRLYDARTFSALLPVESSEGFSANVIFSADSKSLLLHSGNVMRWRDIKSGTLHGQIGGLKERVWHTTFSANRKFIAYSTMDQRAIKIWNLETGQALPVIRNTEIGAGEIALSPDGSTLAAVTWANRDLEVWNTATARPKSLPRHADFLRSFAWSPDGNALAVGSDRAHLLKWPQLVSQRALSSGGIPLSALQFSPDGKTLYGFGREYFINFLQAWDLKNKATASRVLTGKEEAIQCAAISFRHSLLAAAVGNGVQLRDLRSGKAVGQFNGFEAEVPSLSFSPSGDLLAAPNGRSVRVWNVKTGKLLKILTGFSGGVVHVAFSPDGKWLAARAHDSGVVHLWSSATWKLHRSLPRYGGGHDGFVFSPDAKWVALNAHRGIFVHECGSGKQIAALPGIADQGMIEFSNDGKILACASDNDASLKLWRTNTWTLAATMTQWPAERNDPLNWIAFTPEGFYTGSKDCEKYIRWRVGDELFSAEKYKADFYRPDEIRQALSN